MDALLAEAQMVRRVSLFLSKCVKQIMEVILASMCSFAVMRVAHLCSSVSDGPNFVSSSTPRRYLAYTAAFSRRHTLQQIYDFLCSRLRFCREDIRLWKFKDEVRDAAETPQVEFVMV